PFTGRQFSLLINPTSCKTICPPKCWAILGKTTGYIYKGRVMLGESVGSLKPQQRVRHWAIVLLLDLPLDMSSFLTFPLCIDHDTHSYLYPLLSPYLNPGRNIIWMVNPLAGQRLCPCFIFIF